MYTITILYEISVVFIMYLSFEYKKKKKKKRRRKPSNTFEFN